MAYLSEDAIKAMGFKLIGKSVKISDKAVFYDCDRIEIGDNSRIDDFCVVSGRVVIGRNVHITVFCNIAGGEPGVMIDDYATLAYGCYVFSQSDDYSGESMTNSTIPAKYKKEKKEAVRIEKFSIIGARATILPGVTISEGCSVGAMSLVTRSTSPWGLYVGIPALRRKDKATAPKILVKEYEKHHDSI
jgi:acetyltransferase-like isoleucine patch superfamily enzyme